MLIRRADLKDYSNIIKIRNPHVLIPESLEKSESSKYYSQNGFLLDDYLEHTFKNDLNKIFLIAESDFGIMGYIRIDTNTDDDFIKMDRRGEIEWTNLDFQKKYYQLPHFELGAILVNFDSRGKKTGTTLLEYAIAGILAETSYKELVLNLFSFIMVEPIKNDASLKFHEKNGFVKIAELKPCDLFGFSGYKSILMMRTIKRSSQEKWN